jgi:hypothetical protein
MHHRHNIARSAIVLLEQGNGTQRKERKRKKNRITRKRGRLLCAVVGWPQRQLAKEHGHERGGHASPPRAALFLAPL